ncbi:hypothetical protein O3P69_009496 [Scylla paramamosain]|uniref:Uncharacterized protein n=1 Tax=Scylla paramamosain TaxID=85552 RepID=A0AAW0STY0_SCYPA
MLEKKGEDRSGAERLQDYPEDDLCPPRGRSVECPCPRGGEKCVSTLWAGRRVVVALALVRRCVGCLCPRAGEALG